MIKRLSFKLWGSQNKDDELKRHFLELRRILCALLKVGYICTYIQRGCVYCNPDLIESATTQVSANIGNYEHILVSKPYSSSGYKISPSTTRNRNSAAYFSFKANPPEACTAVREKFQGT